MPFNKIWDQSRLPEKKKTSATFQTEKEVILYAIEKYDEADPSSRYFSNWYKESEYGIKRPDRSSLSDFHFWSRRRDQEVFKQIAEYCSDEDIIRALFERDILEESLWEGVPFLDNVNIPDDIIARIYEARDSHPHREVFMRVMKKTEYKYITEETKAKIDAAVAELDAAIRKEKEDKTKQKLTAFLTTAAATKSVLTGNSIEDVVEQTITSDVDDAVLDYMNKLFDK